MSVPFSKEWILAKANDEDGFEVAAGRPSPKSSAPTAAPNPDLMYAMKCQEILALARALLKTKPDLSTFCRDVLGDSGMARKLFPSNDEMSKFEQSPEFFEIQNMISFRRDLHDLAECESKLPATG